MAQLSTVMTMPRQHEVHAPSKHQTAALAAWLPMVSLVACIVTLFYIAQASDLTATGYNIQDLQGQESNWKLKNQQLELELAKAKSLASIEAAATGRLLMVQPKDVVYVHVDSVDRSGQRVSGSSRGEPRTSQEIPAVTTTQQSAGQTRGDLFASMWSSLTSMLIPTPKPLR